MGIVAITLNIVGVVGYFAAFIFHVRRTFAQLATLPYNKYRMGNLVSGARACAKGLQGTGLAHAESPRNCTALCARCLMPRPQPAPPPHLAPRQVVRLQTRLITLAMAFFVLCTITYTFVGFNSCSSYVISWLGERRGRTRRPASRPLPPPAR